MNDSIAKHYLEEAVRSFRSYRKLAEKALAQVDEGEFFAALDEESNSIAVIIKHMTGNMFSRWTDFLTTDGEKPDRHRDMEFVLTPEMSRADLMERWERGWRCVFEAIEPLQPEDLSRVVFIRGEEHTVLQAINRQQTHYAMHIGQIIFLAKHFKSAGWKSLSIPRNRSADYNTYLTDQMKATEGKLNQDRFDSVQDFIKETESK
ncbi:MAG: DUF1572 family protein [Acidobacteria bacterium]|nr:DUF1572 family protein [Acidobacteriota bacterium]